MSCFLLHAVSRRSLWNTAKSRPSRLVSATVIVNLLFTSWKLCFSLFSDLQSFTYLAWKSRFFLKLHTRVYKFTYPIFRFSYSPYISLKLRQFNSDSRIFPIRTWQVCISLLASIYFSFYFKHVLLYFFLWDEEKVLYILSRLQVCNQIQFMNACWLVLERILSTSFLTSSLNLRKLMKLRMAIKKKSSPHFDISFVIFKERAFLDRVSFYTVACRLFNI